MICIEFFANECVGHLVGGRCWTTGGQVRLFPHDLLERRSSSKTDVYTTIQHGYFENDKVQIHSRTTAGN